MKIGLGITTYNRPDFFFKTSLSALNNLTSATKFYAYNDGSTKKYTNYPIQFTSIFVEKENKGVAHAKNTLLKEMMNDGMDYLFLLEDDIEPISDKAITSYIEAHKKHDIHHFNFAHHGAANRGGYIDKYDTIEFYPNCIGAFSFYTRHCIETVGYMDEHFHNAWEHVEHTARIARAGLTSPFWFFADVENSEEYLKELDPSLEKSSIRPTADWLKNKEEGLTYWKKKDGIGLPPKLINI